MGVSRVISLIHHGIRKKTASAELTGTSFDSCRLIVLSGNQLSEPESRRSKRRIKLSRTRERVRTNRMILLRAAKPTEHVRATT
jgi:hypothetical protein